MADQDDKDLSGTAEQEGADTGATTASAKKTAAKKTSAAAGSTAKKAAAKKAAAKKAPAKAAESSTEPAAEKATAKKTAAKKTAASSAAASNTTEGAGGTLKVHHLRPAPGARTAKSRVGRGEAGVRGKTAGRGTKGTKARGQVPAGFEGGQMPLHMRLPKLRGFKNPFRTQYQVVNLDTLAALYPSGGRVTKDDLVAKGAVRKGQPVKVLGTGDVSVKLEVVVDAYSASAKEKILAAGGSVAQE